MEHPVPTRLTLASRGGAIPGDDGSRAKRMVTALLIPDERVKRFDKHYRRDTKIK